MKIYTVRDAQGIMLMKIGGVTADMIIRDASGKWRKWQTDNGKVDCYEFTEDMVFGLAENDYRNHFQMFLWKGTKFIDDNC